MPTHVAKPLAPEDIAIGDHVAVLSIVTQHLNIAAYLGCEQPWNKRPDVLRIRWLPTDDLGSPMRVIRICLPFILVEMLDGKSRTLDTRQVQLARLSDDFAKKAGKRLRPGRAASDSND